MATIQNTLKERGKTHGNFSDNSLISQSLKAVIQSHDSELEPMMREALDMICHKVGRILAGNAKHKDHWDDIAGYATLVSERI